jgi:cation transport ATPase
VQQIHINRNRINSIEFDNPDINIPLVPGNECSIELPIINYSSPTHVHLSVSDALRKNVRFLSDNVYVANQEFAPVVIKLPADLTTLEGEIKVTTGYGSLTKSFRVVIGEKPVMSKPRSVIDVDDKLALPNYKRNRRSSQKDRDVNSSKNPNKNRKRKISFSFPDKFILPLLMILLVMVILLVTFAFNLIHVMYGALAVSILIIILMVYAGMHLLAKNN